MNESIKIKEIKINTGIKRYEIKTNILGYGSKGIPGNDGKDGVIFTPNVDEEGNLSWTNDGKLINPETVNITGPEGPQGIQGIPGPEGPQGPQGIQGPQGEPGKDGKDGKDGVDGTVVFEELTEEQRNSLKGERGPMGPMGPQGPEGKQGPQGPAGPSGGVTQYAQLPDKPTINGTEVYGGKQLWQFGIQPELKSGTNIKTINGQSILGKGNIEIEGGTGGGITEIPVATRDTLGGIKVGNNLTIEEDGTLNALASGGGEGYDDVPIGSIVEYEGEEVPDGWVELDESGERNYIQCEMTDRLTVPDSNYVLIPFNNNLIMGSAFTYDTDTNEVVIDSKSNIDKVKLHFHSVITAGGEQPVTCFEVLVYKNDEIALIANESMELGSSRTAVSVDRVVECAPGDRFRVEIKSYDNIFILLNTYGRTVFSVEDMSNTVIIGDTEGSNVTNVGTVLFESTEGSNQNITLSEAMSGFEYVDITYGLANDKRVRRISGDTPTFSLDRLLVVGTSVYTRLTTYSVSGININVGAYALKYDTDGRWVTEAADASPLNIFKVVGYNQLGGDLIVDERQTSALTVTYNPTVVGTSGNWKIPESNVDVQYPLNDVISQMGTGLSIDPATGDIVIGKDISKVMVILKATYYTTGGGSDKVWGEYITKNSERVSQSTFTPIAGNFTNLTDSILIDVAEGDVIGLAFYGQQGDQIGRNKNTTLTVFEIPNTNIIKESSRLNLITDGDPVKAGYKIDGKDVYVKRVSVPSLPNNGLLEVDSGVPNTYEIEYYVGTVINSNKYTLILPSEGTNYMRAGFDRGTGNYKLQITTNSDRTTWKAHFKIYYY